MVGDVEVSIIVPVYNVSKYLRKCLDSLINQSLDSFEIIIVNDGSTDDSELIINEYAAKFPDKIFAYTKTNGGLGLARNYGIERARGKYIGFVDSDDWVDPKMFKALYNMTKYGHDLVICDFIEIKDGWESGHIAKGFRGNKLNKREVVLNSMNPAVAWNKLYDRKFFELIKFPDCWYEDIGTTPIYASYATSIGYIDIPLYYYRQRNGSIINSTDERTLGVIKAWERVLTNINGDYLQEATMAICQSISAFIDFKSEYADDFLDFAKKHREIISNNHYFKEAVKNKTIHNILEMNLIPKKIHYFWFGPGKKSDLINKCIDSWKKHAGDYEIIEWNESNCDINVNRYVKEAYAAKKWAFVADYFRIQVIHEQGGIYVDTDTEFMKRVDSLRISKAFFAFETRNVVHAGIFGAIPQHPLIKQWLDSYKQDHFRNSIGTFNTSNTIVKRLTAILVGNYNITMNGQYQVLKESIKIYPPNVLTINIYDGKNIVEHHYDASWWDIKDEVSYKNTVLSDFFLREEKVHSSPEHNSEIDFYKKLIHTYENTLSWKITAPLRKIRALTKRK
jgi:glycosyltransferase involved in cell wall biosynthesis